MVPKNLSYFPESSYFINIVLFSKMFSHEDLFWPFYFDANINKTSLNLV